MPLLICRHLRKGAPSNPLSRANPGNNNRSIQPPMGARFRLKASVDISMLNPQSKIVAQALKDYGLIVADNGSAFYLSGASDAVGATNQFAITWNDDDIQDTIHGLKSLLFTNFEVVDLSPSVTNVSPAQAAAGASVTISGGNYSGAAGQLSVWFGTYQVPATITDNAHLTAVAPPGAGTVEVRVQSGVTGADPSANYTSSIWGYGVSLTSAAGHFTCQALDPFHAWLAANGLPSDGSADYLDPDADGMNNWQEYLAGTNPTNAGSVFQITGAQVLPSGQFVLCWQSVSNRRYDVLSSTNLAAGAGAFMLSPGAANLTATPPQNTWTGSVSTASTRAFYKLTSHP